MAIHFVLKAAVLPSALAATRANLLIYSTVLRIFIAEVDGLRVPR